SSVTGAYGGPQQPRIAKMAPPPMKLPPGLSAENGLLYYNGSARADVDYQQYPVRVPGRYPVRNAAYEEETETSRGQAGANTGAVSAAPSANYDNGIAGNCDQGCDQCGDNCYTGCYGWLYGLFHGAVFPGKLGYQWSAGYDNLAMTRNNGAKRVVVFDT